MKKSHFLILVLNAFQPMYITPSKFHDYTHTESIIFPHIKNFMTLYLSYWYFKFGWKCKLFQNMWQSIYISTDSIEIKSSWLNTEKHSKNCSQLLRPTLWWVNTSIISTDEYQNWRKIKNMNSKANIKKTKIRCIRYSIHSKYYSIYHYSIRRTRIIIEKNN